MDADRARFESPEPFLPGAQLYCLGIENPRTRRLEVGALGRLEWPRGWTYYVGRAHHGWTRRVGRFQGDFAVHWHVDYLLRDNPGNLRGVQPVDWDGDRECELVKLVGGVGDLRPLKRGFGASDCEAGCPAHAWVGSQDPSQVYPRIRERVSESSGWVRCDTCAWRWVD